MNSNIITRTIKILETDPDFFVPVKQLWLLLQREGLALNLELDDFYQMLLNDERFEVTPGVDHTQGFEDDLEIARKMEREMEAMEFYGGPCVKLVSRKMTTEAVFGAMSRSLTRLNEALQGVWETRPEGDQTTADQLLDILAAGQQLELEIKELVESKGLEKAVKKNE